MQRIHTEKSTLKTFVKDLARPAVHRGRAMIRETEAAWKLSSVRREIRRQHPGLNLSIDPRDEMFNYLADCWASRRQAELVYLKQGEDMVTILRNILAANGMEAHSILDFACGHGRVTRWLVELCRHAAITASDINPQAVDFVRDRLGVPGFYSTHDAASLGHHGQFHVIFVASLFSHLTVRHWEEWAAQLAKMLEPGGLLVFSANGISISEEQMGAKLAPGFYYNEANETEGRLEGDYYGTAFVSEGFVREVFLKTGLGTISDYKPLGLLGHQDLYAFQRRR
jgi:2-polyprenyl-3-methyl-5-hydroxy-6-metoxy-1,4-benzoquinol methylase